MLRYVEAEDHGLRDVADLEHIGRLPNLLAPRHLGDVNHAFDTRLDLKEGTEVGEACDRSPDAIANLVPVSDAVPGMRKQLLHAERDPARLGFHLQDLDGDLLPCGEDVLHLPHAGPRDLPDVKQAVHSTEVDEGAIVCEAANGPLQRVSDVISE